MLVKLLCYYEEEFKKRVFVHVGGVEGGSKVQEIWKSFGGGGNLRFIASKDSGKSIACSYYLESC